MFTGVAFYSFVVGSMTTLLTTAETQENSLTSKLKAFEDFAEEANLDELLKTKITHFIMNNYSELFSKVDDDQMISELPPNLKEEIMFN